MKAVEQDITSKTKTAAYDSINNEARQALATLVFDRKISVRQASKDLGIKYSTGKALIQRYRKIGNIERKRGQRITKEII